MLRSSALFCRRFQSIALQENGSEQSDENERFGDHENLPYRPKFGWSEHEPSCQRDEEEIG